MTENRICPLCGGRANQLRYASPLEIRDCSCGLTFLGIHPSTAERKMIYSEEYYRSWGVKGENDELPRAMKHRTFAARLDRIAGHIRSGKVLDVGCATGYFLEVARDRGWDVHGVELSEYSARIAQGKFGDRVHNGTLEDACFDDGSFDLVTLSDLVEHVPDPVIFMGEVWRILNPGGLVLIVTPNVASISERLMRGRWSHYKEEHLFYFSPQTIRQLLSMAGFETLLVESASKFLNLKYILSQLTTYPHPLLTPLSRIVSTLSPAVLQTYPLPLPCGEMLVLASKDRSL